MARILTVCARDYAIIKNKQNRMKVKCNANKIKVSPLTLKLAGVTSDPLTGW